MYFVQLNLTSAIFHALHLVPMRLKHLQIRRAENQDKTWLFDTMREQCRKIGDLNLTRSQNGEYFQPDLWNCVL